MTQTPGHAAIDVPHVRDLVYGEGFAGLPGLFPAAWADRLRHDFSAAFDGALGREHGTIPRGPARHYVAVHPEHVSGFAELAGHPVLTALWDLMLGHDYKIVELGFDVPLPGAVHQPWHRDFPAPPETAQGRLTSLAVNVTTVDVTPEFGPLEIAPGTHWDDGAGFAHGMFPQQEATARYASLAVCKLPRRGDVSVRSGLTVHRGTPNTAASMRGVLILGITNRDVDTSVHSLQVTGTALSRFPASVRDHLECSVVDQLTPIVQRHDIEGLVLGAPDA